jgi:hypothetical protein
MVCTLLAKPFSSAFQARNTLWWTLPHRRLPTPAWPRGSGHQTWDFRAACSVGQCHRARTGRRYRAFNDALAFVEQITGRIWGSRSNGTKNGRAG